MPKLKPETIAARREQILRAALTCFAQKGYHQTTLDDIVDEAGLSKGSVYVYFDSKKALYLALSEWLLLEAGISQVLAGHGTTALEKLGTALLALTAAMREPRFQETAPLLMDMWLQNLQDPDFQQLFAAQYDQGRQALIKIIEEGITAGEFKPLHASSLANVFLGVFDGLMVQELIDGSAVDWTAVGETLLTLVDGLLAGPAPT